MPTASEYGADVVCDLASRRWNCCVSTADNLGCQNPSTLSIAAPALESSSTITQLNTPVPSSAQLTPIIGSIPSVSAPDSAAASASPASNDTSASTRSPASTSAANKTMAFSGSPTRNTSTLVLTATSHGQHTSASSTAASTQITQDGAGEYSMLLPRCAFLVACD